MISFVNGRFVREAEAVVSVSDRGFLLGDGVFETVPVFGGGLFAWQRHEPRLVSGLRVIGLELPCSAAELRETARELLARNGVAEGVLRITISRGPGERGYSARGTGPATLAMTLHHAAKPPTPDALGWRLVTSPFRIAAGASFSQCKHTSRLLQVLARTEAERAGANEALLLNTDGAVAEATAANVFWIESERLCTPSLDSGALAGITRALVMELARKLGIETQQTIAPAQVLPRADGVFLTSSTLGVVEVVRLDASTLKRSPITARLREAYAALVEEFRTTGRETI